MIVACLYLCVRTDTVDISGNLEIDKTKVLMKNGRLMEVESVAEYSPWSILKYF